MTTTRPKTGTVNRLAWFASAALLAFIAYAGQAGPTPEPNLTAGFAALAVACVLAGSRNRTTGRYRK